MGARGSGLRLWLLPLVPFVLLATANSADYRYGASDLAFYGPAVMRQLDPGLFPRDTPIIDAQARLTFMDETVAAISRLTTGDLPTLFLGLYLLTLALLAAGIGAIGASLYRSRWTTIALLGAMTLRHAIAKSGTNSLEGYFHPRQLAFAFGTLAIAAFLRGRTTVAALALCAAGSLHPTTTLWLAIWLGVATLVARPEWRKWLGAAIVAVVAVAIWALTLGPLAGRFVTMDDEWLATLADKGYLFPLAWPLAAWLVNLAYIPLIAGLYAYRRRCGLLAPREPALVAGCLTLVVIFLSTLPFNAARVAFAIQLQPARVFWMLDLLAIIYLVWAIAEGRRTPGSRRASLAAAALAVLSLARGAYIMHVEFPGRSLFGREPGGDWGRIAAWVRSTPKDSSWLADPLHAALYGTSLRMAAAHDVFVEGTKDAAIGMYNQNITLRTRDRLKRVALFTQMSADELRDVGRDYQLDYLISEAEMPMPLVHQSGPIRIYRLR